MKFVLTCGTAEVHSSWSPSGETLVALTIEGDGREVTFLLMPEEVGVLAAQLGWEQRDIDAEELRSSLFRAARGEFVQ